tara:strand:- start:761 stop:1282 length:522 start_codon:yes stop_codon:yes gene_type:complete
MNNLKKLKLKIPSKKIKKRVEQIGHELSQEYKRKNPIFIGVLNGSFMFLSDLVRALSIECEISFIQLKSYDGKKSTGNVDIIKNFDVNLKNRHVVIVEDIIDTGTTLKFLLNKINEIPIKSVRIATLLLRDTKSSFEFTIDHIGFEISQEFVVGYGLDYNQKFRHLDSIYVSE